MSAADPETTDRVEIRCAKPFQAGVVRSVRRRGDLSVTLVAKITYQLRHGSCVPLDDGDPIREAEEHWEDNPQKSLRAVPDLVPSKAAPEVLVLGHARLPTGTKARSVIVRVVVGSVDKCVEAFSPRRFSRDGQYEELYLLSEIPLLWEYASGGPDSDNPVGIDPTTADTSGHRALPALVPPAFPVSVGSSIPSIGLGPIARSWPARARRLRPEDARWVDNPMSGPIPPGFDDRFFNCAPADQQLDRPIHPDERIILEGLDANLPRLVTNLPGLEPRVVCDVELPVPKLVADTLVVDTDRNLLTLTFRGRVDLPLGFGRVRFTIVPARLGEEISEADLTRSREENPTLMIQLSQDAQAALSTTNMGLDTHGGHSALPFSSASGSSGRREAAPAAARGDGALPFRTKQVMAESTQPIPLHMVPVSAPKPPPPAPPPPPPPAPSAPLAAPVVVPPPPPSAVSVAQVIQASAPPLVPAPVAAVGPMMAPPPPPSSPGAIRPPGAAAPVLGGLGATLGSATVAAASTAGKPSYLVAEAAAATAAAPPPPPPAIVGAAKATHAEELPSAKAASDKALEAEQKRSKKVEKREESSLLQRRALIDLLHFNPLLPPRLRRARAFADLLAAASKVKGFRRQDEGNLQEKDDRGALDVVRVLSMAVPVEASNLRSVADAVLDDVNDFDIPILLVAGELRPTFDEVEVLKATVSIAQAFGASDKRVQATVAVVNEALAASIPPTGKAAAGLLQQLEQATAGLNLPPRYIQESVERSLLEQRKYRQRSMFGGPRLRADIVVGVSSFPIYLPEDVSTKLPLLPAFAVHALVELRPREDVGESHAEAMLCLALGRVLRTSR